MTETPEADLPKVVFSCCYCGRILTDETAPDWIGVSIYDKDTGEPGQMWFAHEVCFRSKLHPDYNESVPDDLDWENAEVVDPTDDDGEEAPNDDSR